MLLQDKCLIIGEIAQAHDGSLGTAHAYIDAVADAGADAVKFQTHIATAESTRNEPWRVQFSRQDATRFEYWERMEFTEEQWRGLKEHADERGLIFLSSPFSVEAVDLLDRVGVPAWKVASGEVGSRSMLGRMLETQKPMMLSTGMSSLTEIDTAVQLIREHGVPFSVFQCTSSYPCEAEDVGIDMISYFRDRYDCPVGLSDHSGTIFPSIVAAGVGAQLIEVHVTFSKKMFGPDVSSSVTCDEFETLVNGVRFAERMLKNPVDKDAKSEQLESMRKLFSKSLTARVDIPEGSVIRKADLTAKKPGSGIPEDRINDVVGRRAERSIAADELLAPDDVEGLH